MKIRNLVKVGNVQDEDLGGNIVCYELHDLDVDRWNEKALKSNREQFIRILGYEPLNDAEVIRWVREISKKVPV